MTAATFSEAAQENLRRMSPEDRAFWVALCERDEHGEPLWSRKARETRELQAKEEERMDRMYTSGRSRDDFDYESWSVVAELGADLLRGIVERNEPWPSE